MRDWEIKRKHINSIVDAITLTHKRNIDTVCLCHPRLNLIANGIFIRCLVLGLPHMSLVVWVTDANIKSDKECAENGTSETGGIF